MTCTDTFASKRVCVFHVKGWTIKNICEARFGEGIRGCMCMHVRTVTCQCTSPLLTSWPPDIMPAWRQSLWQPVSAHAQEGKEQWERHWTRRHLSEQRKMRSIAKNEGTEKRRKVQSSLGVSKFTFGLGSF